MVIIEVQLDSGVWVKIGDCSSAPETIRAVMTTNAKSNPKWRKFRALDSKTGQLVDMHFVI